MVRLVTVVLIVAVISCVIAAPTEERKETRSRYIANASKGSIGVANVTGGMFGAGSFSIGHGGQSSGKGDGGHGGNIGTNSYGGQGGDSGHTSYA